MITDQQFYEQQAVRTIPEAYQWATFSAPELAKRIIGDFAGDSQLTSATIVGPAGSGKTSLACAMFRQAIANGSRGMFVSAFDLAKARAQSPLGQGECPLIERAISCRLLLVDDLGQERIFNNSAVSEVLFERHQRMRPLIVTTGLSPEQLIERYGDGIARRLLEIGRVNVVRLGMRPKNSVG